MSKQRRDEEKRRRRQKRQEKSQAQQRSPEKPGALKNLAATLTDLKQHLKVPEPPRWPGGCDPSLDRPDLVKLDLGQFATNGSPGREKLRQLESRLRKGLLEFLPGLHDWAMEEFLWHGLPGDDWQPIDAYLATAGDRYPPAAQAQLRLWKQARLGIFEVGEVGEDTLMLREYDAIKGTITASPLRTMTLNIGGINTYRKDQGKMLLTYLAPWVPAEGLFCGLGYGSMLPLRDVGVLAPFLGLNYLEAACRTLPWKQNRAAAQECLRVWQQRDWQGWLEERLTTPFWAFVTSRPAAAPEVRLVRQLLSSPAETARKIGIYFDVEHGPAEGLVAGATAVTPVDLASKNTWALAEYQAYRKMAGPPPGTIGVPTFGTFGPR